MVAARYSLGRILAQSQAGLYVCRSCRHQRSRPSTLVQQRFASTEELRGNKKLNQQWTASESPSLRDRRPGESYTEGQPLQSNSEQGTYDNAIAPRRTTQAQSTTQSQIPTSSQKTIEVPEYVPAETWDGLEFVGSTGSWRDVPAQPSDDFSAWLDPNSLVAADRAELISCLHQAMVECLTSHQAGLDPSSVLHMDSALLDERTISALGSARIIPSERGEVSQVQFASDAEAKEIVELLAAVDTQLKDGQSEVSSELQEETPVDIEAAAEVESASPTIETDIAQPQQEQSITSQRPSTKYRVQDESFLDSRLDMEDPVTFTVFKRFSQLAGHRVPDPILNTLFSSNKPLCFLIEQLDEMVVRPKPTRLADILMNNSTISAMSNVLVFPRRETSVDKEKEVGRWKVIEKELQDRGLPVLGKLKL